MKKGIAIVLILLIIVVWVTVQVINTTNRQKEILAFNKQYENYLGKDLYGIDIVTVINKVTDNNEKYNIPKDEKGMYIEDEENSIKVELELIASVDEVTGKKEMVTHPMERLQEVGLEGFITNFNLTIFQCKNIEYHKQSGKISKMVFQQIEE